jgi:hypothetical protein
MSESRGTQSDLTWTLVTTTLVASSVLSAPFLIDGISYIKVAVALILISMLMPKVLMALISGTTSNKIALGLFTFLALNVFLIFLSLTSYRDVFGAPGRHNGLLNGIVCIYLFLIGIYAKRYWNFIDLFKTIAIVATAKSLVIILLTLLNLETKTILSSNNLSSSIFSENTNLIAPLVCAGFVSSLISYRNSKSVIFLVFLIPISIVAIQLAVFQVYLCLCISLLVLYSSRLKCQFKSIWLMAVIFLSYFGGLTLALRGTFDFDPSIKERTDILRQLREVIGDFTFFPSNFDTVSDFSGKFESFSGNQFIDDFHNVFIQIFFSYGLIFGLLFLVLSIIPYFPSSLPRRESLEFLAVHTSFIVSLLIGISSQNYIYIYFLSLGYSYATFRKREHVTGKGIREKHASRLSVKSRLPAWTLTILMIAVPVSVQILDLSARSKISNITSQLQGSDASSANKFNRLLILLRDLDDAGYRELLARNFYTIGACSYGDEVYRMMAETNRNEVRLKSLRTLRGNCKQVGE